ncbi:hypothetical protein EMIT043CA1_60063 [Pseudomonas brassicacearum]
MGARLARDTGDSVFLGEMRRLHREQALLPQFHSFTVSPFHSSTVPELPQFLELPAPQGRPCPHSSSRTFEESGTRLLHCATFCFAGQSRDHHCHRF